MKNKKDKFSPSIGQNILFATISIVTSVLLVVSLLYFSIFLRTTNYLISSQSREINKQIVLNYESYINDVIETANYLQGKILFLDLNQNQKELKTLLETSSELKKDVVRIIILDQIGQIEISSKENLSRTESFKATRWFSKVIENPSIFHFSAPYSHFIKEEWHTNDIISVAKGIEYKINGIQKKGVLLIDLNFERIIDLGKKTNLGEGGHILILSDDDSLIYTSHPNGSSNVRESSALAIENFFGGFKASINNRDVYINVNTLSHTRWRIVTVNNTDSIKKARKDLSITLSIIFIISLAVAGAAGAILSIRIKRPLTQLREGMATLEKGDFTATLQITGQREIVLMANSFNQMSHKIHILMEKVLTEQRDKRRTELRALQTQINPHFLYNTLDSIVWLAENNRNEDVVTTVVALAKFFRISISRGENFIPVKSEIEHIKNYLTIQRIRYVNRFESFFEIDESLSDKIVMKLILQPLVENAIYHGGAEDNEMSRITIRCHSDNTFLIFEVENSGYGIDQKRIEEIYTILRGENSRSSVGMRNVYLRLKLYYGDKADIVITSELDIMTNIKLLIPLDKMQMEEK